MNKYIIHLKTLVFPLLLLLMLLAIVSCKNDEENKIEGTDLYGKWNWLSSISGLYGTILTPQSEGYSLSIEFKSTRKIEFRKNDTITSEKLFSIAHDVSISNLPIIVVEDDPTWSYKINSDTLFLNNVCPTCYNEKYIRVK